MPNINLIAARRVEKRRIERLSRQVFFGMTTSVGVLVMVSSFLLVQRMELNSQLAEADRRMEKLQPTLKEIAQIKHDTEERRPKVESLEKARSQTLRWCALFNVLSRSLPARTWIEQLDSADGNMINLNVITDTQTTAGQTASLLQRQPLFTDVNIPGTSSSGEGKDRKVRFEIIATVRPLTPPSPPPAGAPAGTRAASTAKGVNDHA